MAASEILFIAFYSVYFVYLLHYLAYIMEYYYAFEIKMTEKVSGKDARHLKKLDQLLNKPLKKAYILSNDPETQNISDNITAIHAAMFVG